MKKLIPFLFLSVSAISVHAADVVSYKEEVPSAKNSSSINSGHYDSSPWGGFYAGVQTGVNFLKNDHQALLYNGRGMYNFHSTASKTFHAPLASGFAGFNIQNDNIVYGLEGDAGYNWHKSDSITNISGPEAMLNIRTRNQFLGSVRGRLGVAIDKTLLYATAGWGIATISTEAGGTLLQGTTITKKNAFNNVTVGAGADYAVTDNMFARVSYRYTNYKSKDFDINNEIHERINPKQHTVTAGLGMKFQALNQDQELMVFSP